MKPIERSARSRTMWLMLSMLGALALAQPAQAQRQGLRGPMWACSTSQFGAIVAANAMNGKRCRKQHFAPGLGLFFFSMEERNGAPSKKCVVPKSLAAPIVQINNNVQVGVSLFGGNVELTSLQANAYVAPKTWYFCAPASAAAPIIQKNNSVQKALSIGGGNVLLQSDQVNVAAPASAAQPVVQINNNVQVGVSIGGGDVMLSSTQVNTVG
jgi:hypothetical protein